jgi:hypothetical protein
MRMRTISDRRRRTRKKNMQTQRRTRGTTTSDFGKGRTRLSRIAPVRLSLTRMFSPGTSGVLVSSVRIAGACAVLCAFSACGRNSPPSPAREYMLEQASGVELGMALSEVRKARNVIVDENGVWESLDRYRNTSFVFEGMPLWSSSESRRLQAVVIDRLTPVADTSRRRTLESIRARWDRVAGPPTDSVAFWSPSFSTGGDYRRTLIFWCRSDVLLLLMYPSDHDGERDRYSLVRAVIQNPDFELASGYGIPYDDMDCSGRSRVREQAATQRDEGRSRSSDFSRVDHMGYGRRGSKVSGARPFVKPRQ